MHSLTRRDLIAARSTLFLNLVERIAPQGGDSRRVNLAEDAGCPNQRSGVVGVVVGCVRVEGTDSDRVAGLEKFLVSDVHGDVPDSVLVIACFVVPAEEQQVAGAKIVVTLADVNRLPRFDHLVRVPAQNDAVHEIGGFHEAAAIDRFGRVGSPKVRETE